MNNGIFTEALAKRIQDDYAASIRNFGGMSERYSAVLQELGGEEALCFQFLVSAMPISDAATYDGKLLLSFVRNSLRIRKAVPWGDTIPAEIFLNYILFYRVNNEEIENYRDIFSAELLPRISGMSMQDAALEVNYWCLEKATYQSTDDRTQSPLSMMKNGSGRCGEESAFTVSALRSAGIPARQCYAPKWSHCDDNHAWVELWADGGWYYMGACEPEPVLNRGWFTYAATKAMLVHSRLFSGLVSDESVIAEDGSTRVCSRLPAYATTRVVTVQVLGKNGAPLSGIPIRFQVVNYAEFATIAILTTDAGGKVKWETGLGDLIVFAFHDGCSLTRILHTGERDSLVLDFSKQTEDRAVSRDFDFHAPSGKIGRESVPDDQRLERHLRKAETAVSIRKDHENTFFSGDSARKLASRFSECRREIARFLCLAKGNSKEIFDFLNSGGPIRDKTDLLAQLREKDFTDCTCEMLTDTLKNALPYRNCLEPEIFRKYVLSPRIENEFLVPYRTRMNAFFTPEQHKTFQENPAAVYRYIEGAVRLRDDLDYAPLIADPVRLLQTGVGSELSRRVLFAAVCRSFGIPARLNPVTGRAEYYQAGIWKNADGSISRKIRLTILNRGYELFCRRNFSIAKLEQDHFHTLNFADLTIKEKTELLLEPGMYRILLANRQIDGDILSRVYSLVLKDEPVTVEISGRNGDIASRLKNYSIGDTELLGPAGERDRLSHVTGIRPKNIIALLDIKKEPTEHLLNELLELKNCYRQHRDLSLLLLVPDGASLGYGLLKEVLTALPNASAFRYDGAGFLTRLFEEVQAGDHRLPLVLVCDGAMHMKFHFSNYNVGTASQLLDIVSCLPGTSD